MFIDSFRFDRANSIGYGSVLADENRCRGHFEVFPGMFQTEFAAQTRLMCHYSLNQNTDLIPAFVRVQFEYKFQVPEGKIINALINLKDDIQKDNSTFSFVRIYLGKITIAKGAIEGAVFEKNEFYHRLEKAERILDKQVPQFPI